MFLSKKIVDCCEIHRQPAVGYSVPPPRAVPHTDCTNTRSSLPRGGSEPTNQALRRSPALTANHSSPVPTWGGLENRRSDWSATCDVTQSPFWTRSDILSVQQLVQNNDNNIYVCRVLQAKRLPYTEDVYQTLSV